MLDPSTASQQFTVNMARPPQSAYKVNTPSAQFGVVSSLWLEIGAQRRLYNHETLSHSGKRLPSFKAG
jgi:hypothetical protein